MDYPRGCLPRIKNTKFVIRKVYLSSRLHPTRYSPSIQQSNRRFRHDLTNPRYKSSEKKIINLDYKLRDIPKETIFPEINTRLDGHIMIEFIPDQSERTSNSRLNLNFQAFHPKLDINQ